MHPILHRIAEAYRPLAGRNRLVEGTQLPSPEPAGPVRRMTVLALVAMLLARRP